jgi:hypothetical protein
MMYPWEKTLYHAMAEGMTVHEACKAYEDMPEPAVIFTTLKDDPAFKARYEEALQMWSYAVMDQMTTLADDSSRDFVVKNGIRYENKEAVQRSKLRVSVREKLVEMANPARFRAKEPSVTNTLVLAGMDENQISDKLREIMANVTRRLQEQKEGAAIDVTPERVQDGDTDGGEPLPAPSPPPCPDAEEAPPRRKVQPAPPATPTVLMPSRKGGLSLVYERDPADDQHPALA